MLTYQFLHKHLIDSYTSYRHFDKQCVFLPYLLSPFWPKDWCFPLLSVTVLTLSEIFYRFVCPWYDHKSETKLFCLSLVWCMPSETCCFGLLLFWLIFFCIILKSIDRKHIKSKLLLNISEALKKNHSDRKNIGDFVKLLCSLYDACQNIVVM